jgi:hypothetical protein
MTASNHYSRRALQNEVTTLAATRRGRNEQANRSGFALGQLVGAGMLDRGEVLNSLLAAVTANGYVAQDGIGAARASILSGFSSGLRKPRAVPDGRNRDAAPARSSAPQPVPVLAIVDTDDTARLAERTARALRIWQEAIDPRGTLAETYLASRYLTLDADVAGNVLRWHPRTPWRDDDTGKVLFVPCMLALLRNIETDAPQAIQRTRIDSNARKVARKHYGPARSAAIKIDADDAVTMGLAVSEGLESVLAARQLGFRPAWALGSAGAVAKLPILGGIDCLTLLAERDEANARAVEACARRWHAAGREVIVVEARIGSDLNDALQGAA